MKKRNGFTLVELLAVIVILAIILVIAVPQIMDTIDSARKASLESSVKMVAAQAENQYTVAQTLGTDFNGGELNADGSVKTWATCGAWSGLDTSADAKDYGSCQFYIDKDGAAHVKIVGKAGGKFAKFSTNGCVGTRSTIGENDCKAS